MFPILFKFPSWLPLVGDRAIHTYGLMVALGFFAGLEWVKREGKRQNLPVEKLLDLFFYIVLSAIIGSRTLYVLISEDWLHDPMVFLRVWEGGLVFYGGLIAAVATSYIYMRRHDLPFLRVSDIFVPGVALGHALGRIGCFAAGCCYGKPSPLHSFFSVIYPHTEYSIAPTGIPLYPVQLFESAGEFFIFLILIKLTRHKKFDGEIFLLYLIFYPILRIVLEFFRGDDIRGFLGVLSTSQAISLVWLVIAGLLWFTLRHKKGKIV